MARNQPQELDLEGFLGHKGSGGGGGSFLKNWHKEDNRDARGRAQIDVWLHPSAKIVPLWSHNWFTIGKDKDSGDNVLRTYRFNSMEKEAILRNANKRDKDGAREYPPEICPFSKLLEWLYQAVLNEQISWVDEVFSFDEISGDPFVLHAGGMVGLFNRQDDALDKEEIAQLRKARINRKEAWKENCKPRLQYIFRVVQNDRPGDGCMIALESQSLGDAVKSTIGDRIDDQKPGESWKGDPWKNPYAIRWLYSDNEPFSKKYAARAMLSIEKTEEIQQVFDAEPPSIDELTKDSNIFELRQSFEAHWCHEVVPPWDEIFADAEAELEGTEAAEDPASFDYGANVKEDDESDGAEKSEKVEMVECEVCKNDMPSNVFTCEHCGTEYDPKTEAIVKRGTWPKEEPKGRRASKGKGK